MMTLSYIREQVRLAFDEAAVNDAGFASASAGDASSMDAIIVAKVGDALRWVALHAPAHILAGSGLLADVSFDDPLEVNYDEERNGFYLPSADRYRIIAGMSIQPDNNTRDVVVGVRGEEDSSNLLVFRNLPHTITISEANILSRAHGDGLVFTTLSGNPGMSLWVATQRISTLQLPSDYLRLIRVRGKGWHRAIMGDSLLKEDSNEYLELSDTQGATATLNRPQAAFIEKASPEIELWPACEGLSFTYVKLPVVDGTNIDVPPMAATSFLYYLAYLVLSAYGDSRSNRMLEIATMSLGVPLDRQRT